MIIIIVIFKMTVIIVILECQLYTFVARAIYIQLPLLLLQQ